MNFRRPFVLALSCSLLRCAWGSAGSTGASFLELPFNARAASMGGAGTALSTDGFSTRWNPAGLAFLDGPELAATQLLYLEDTSNTFLGFVQPLSGGQGVGAALQYFRPGAITERDVNDQVIGTFNGYSLAGTLGYGHRVGDTWAVGVSGQRVQSKIADVGASAWSGGAGVQWRPSSLWVFGAAFENFGNDIQFLDQADPLPLTGRLGGAYRWEGELTVAVEGVFKRGAGASGHLGLEWPNEEEKGYAFRSGFNSEYRHELNGMAGFSMGVAVRLLGQDISYAWVPLADLGMAHLFSLQCHWGAAGHATSIQRDEPVNEPTRTEDFFN